MQFFDVLGEGDADFDDARFLEDGDKDASGVNFSQLKKENGAIGGGLEQGRGIELAPAEAGPGLGIDAKNRFPQHSLDGWTDLTVFLDEMNRAGEPGEGQEANFFFRDRGRESQTLHEGRRGWRIFGWLGGARTHTFKSSASLAAKRALIFST